jgi:hypothetical protein
MSDRAFTAAILPDSEKESLCYSLLNEFGVEHIRANPRSGELVHGCLVSSYHQDQAKNPTASLNYQKLTYNCLGCGSHGGLLWFIATMRKCSTTEAFKWLEESSGIAPAGMDSERLLSIIHGYYFPDRIGSDVIPTYSERILDPWLEIVHPYLTDGIPDMGIKGRHIREDNLRRMKIGWDPDPEVDRIIVPHFWKGKLVGWQARRIWDVQGPKYLGTPDFPKDQTLYNFEPKKRYRTLVVMEAPMSVVTKVHLQDVMEDTTLTGTFGSEITDTQIRLMARADHVIFFLDNDEGGWSAMRGTESTPGVSERLMPYTRVSVVQNPWDADPADLDDEDFLDLVRNPVPSVLWRCPAGYVKDYEGREA